MGGMEPKEWCSGCALTQVIPHVPDPKANLLPHVPVSRKIINQEKKCSVETRTHNTDTMIRGVKRACVPLGRYQGRY